ncbi:MAG: hypothetical protein WCD07_03220 [Burkholderiales bacterium]
MTGILLIGVVVAWLMAAIVMGAKIADKLNPPWLRTPAALLLMAILIPLPVVDEIIGGWQFKALCEKNDIKEAELVRAKGMTLSSKSIGPEKVEGTLLKIMAIKRSFQDPATSEKIVEFVDYTAEGGWLIRSLGISETKSPLIFGKSCGLPRGYSSMQELLNAYQIKFIHSLGR